MINKMQKGQVVLALILVMVVALGIGLSIVQKSLVDISTSTKVEQSSRSFSAAEAGIEKALRCNAANSTANCAPMATVDFSGQNQSSAIVTDTSLKPAVSPATQQDPLEYPPLAKEEVAHIWLTNYNSIANPPTCSASPTDSSDRCYTASTLDVYWGLQGTTDKAAIELTLIYYDGSQYKSRKWYIDNASITRNPPNGFQTVNCPSGGATGNSKYQCQVRLGDGSSVGDAALPSSGMMLLRVRLLYNTTSQPLAVQAVGTCNPGCYLPAQARIFDSIGTSGDTKRTVRVFQISKVVPPYFDYAIFSAGEIRK